MDKPPYLPGESIASNIREGMKATIGKLIQYLQYRPYGRPQSNPSEQSLYDAVHILYIEKRLVSGIGEFSHILLIHALYHKCGKSVTTSDAPSPSGTQQQKSSLTKPPSRQAQSGSRESLLLQMAQQRCDYLDILHWTANSTIAKAEGLRTRNRPAPPLRPPLPSSPLPRDAHPSPLPRHRKLRWNKQHQSLEWQYIWRWIKQDQYKARLSIITRALLWPVPATLQSIP